MTAVWIAALAGAVITAGILGVVWYLVPVRVDLRDGLDRISSPPRGHGIADAPTSGTERVGVWTLRHLPAELWKLAPLRDLEILHKPVSAFYGEKRLITVEGVVVA